MLFIILLLVLAVLLFGSSVVIGALGWVFGLVVAAIALVMISAIFHIHPIVVAVIGLVGFFALCGLVMLIAGWVEERPLARTTSDTKEVTRSGKSLAFGIAAVIALAIGIGAAEMQLRYQAQGQSIRDRVGDDYPPNHGFGTGSVAECARRGVNYFIEIGSYPTLSDGRDAAKVASERCRRSLQAF